MEKTFIYQADGSVMCVDSNFEAVQALRSGYYFIHEKASFMGSVLREIKIHDGVQIPNTAMEIVHHFLDIDYIEKYFSDASREIHDNLNIKLKMGIMLYGKQGTGKTTAAYAVGEHLMKTKGASVFTVFSMGEFDYVINFLKDAKKVKDFLSVIIFDECEHAMSDHEDQMKRLLDSSTSIDNNLCFFTTNYFYKIPQTISERPSRIKWCIDVEHITEEDIIYNIVKKMNKELNKSAQLSLNQVKSFVPKMRNKTIDEIKNGYIDYVFETHMSTKGIKEKPKKDKVIIEGTCSGVSDLGDCIHPH